MILYEQGEVGDFVVLQWYCYLKKTGDLDLIVTESAQSPSAFLALFNRCDLYLKLDDEGLVQGAIWLEPHIPGSTYFSTWVREDFRGRMGMQWIREGYSKVFEHYSLVLGLTKQESLLPIHRRLGYTVVSRLPEGWDGGPAWLLSLTEEAFWARHYRTGKGTIRTRPERPDGKRNRISRKRQVSGEARAASRQGAHQPGHHRDHRRKAPA